MLTVEQENAANKKYKLAPCPFCGPGNSVVEIVVNALSNVHWQIACGRCGMHSGVRPDNDLDKLVAHWNTRPQTTLLQAASRLIDAMDRMHANGETFTARVSLAASALRTEISKTQ